MTTLLDRTFLGIEFKDESVVFVFLKNSVSGMSLVSSATFPRNDHEDTVNDIRDFIGSQGVDINKVFVSIPDKWAITKFTDIPPIKGKGKSAIANLMKFEIERHVPFPIETIAYDFLILQKKIKTSSVVFLVVQNEKVDIVKDFLSKFALKPHAITTASFAVLNSIELSGVPVGGLREVIGITSHSNIFDNINETSVSLYISGKNAGLMIVREGLCTHLRTFVIASTHKVDTVVDKFVQFISEVSETLFVERFDKLLISGDISPFKDIKEKIKDGLAIENVSVNEIMEFRGDVQGEDMNGFISAVGACFAGLGIGTHRINILPHKREYEIKKVAPLATKIFLFLVVSVLIGIFTVGIVKQKNHLEELEAALKNNESAVKAIQQITSNIDLLKKQSGVLYNVKQNEITLEILTELTTILPSDSWITNLNYKGFDIKGKKAAGELLITGFAASSSILIPLLEDSAYFEKVEFVGPIKKKGSKEQFKIKAEVPMSSVKESG